jgi:thiosulfate/3-mercaptopyruvate sulfurtransferase
VAHTTIVSPQLLAEHLDDPRWIVIDCRFNLLDPKAGRRAYDAAHIPGAFYADLERDLSGTKTGGNGRHPLPDPTFFAALLETFGACDDSQIVAYDDGADMYAARLWFLCRWIGHDAAAVLDGGIRDWSDAGYAQTAQPSIARGGGSIAVRLQPELTVSADEILAQLDGVSVVDARAGERFRGEVEPLDAKAGHIPGARNRWFKENYDESGRFKSPERLRAELARYGPPARVVNQCGSGVSAAVNALAMEIAGLRGARLYPGSWSEWSSNPQRPVETGPERA